jgi:hypothetical protein
MKEKKMREIDEAREEEIRRMRNDRRRVDRNAKDQTAEIESLKKAITKLRHEAE